MKIAVASFALALGLTALSVDASAQILRPAPPPEAPPAPKLVDPKAPVDPNEVIVCREDTNTGQRISRRICRTKRVWAQIEGDSQTYIHSLQEKGKTACTDGSC